MLCERAQSYAKVAIGDRYIWTQTANVFMSVLVPLVALSFLDDHGIITSQIITTAAQIAVFSMAIQLSAVSIEEHSPFWIAARKVALVGSGLTWILLAMWYPDIRQHAIMATAFFFSMLVGEMSSIWRSIVINASGSRYVLLLINFFATASRLLCFFILLRPLGAFESFIWSATLSNIVRTAGVYVASRKVENIQVSSQSIDRKRVNLVVRLGAFFERSPGTLVVVVLTSIAPFWGMTLKEYAVALPLMNISIAIASVTWTRFENVENVNLLLPIKFLTIFSFGAIFITLLAISLVPANLFNAESINNLKIYPITLVVGPIFFGFSTALAVFTYGHITSILKICVIAVIFIIFGSFGFMVGMAVNVGYFIFIRRRDLSLFWFRNSTASSLPFKNSSDKETRI
jgi:hypothetical protein